MNEFPFSALDPAELDRYARQVRYSNWGAESQRLLSRSRAAIVGVGALGSALAEILVRAGTGHLRIADRDLLSLNNLHRQTLFTEQDARQQLPKVEAATARLQAINSGVQIEALAIDVNTENIDQFLEGVDVLLDGTDNFETRLVMNDAALRHNIPLVHGGCVGCDGQMMVVLPGETPCLRSLLPDEPQSDAATCESVGVLMPIVSLIASLQGIEALKLLSGNRSAVNRKLVVVSLWDNRIRQIGLDHLPISEVPRTAAAGHRTGFQRDSSGPGNDGRAEPAVGNDGVRILSLCGRNAVQITGGWTGRGFPGLETVARLLIEEGGEKRSRFVVRCSIGQLRLAVFEDGRVVVEGTEDQAEAMSALREMQSRLEGLGNGLRGNAGLGTSVQPL